MARKATLISAERTENDVTLEIEFEIDGETTTKRYPFVQGGAQGITIMVDTIAAELARLCGLEDTHAYAVTKIGVVVAEV